MTIDKFGRHIHKHIVRRHLAEEDAVANFLKHSKFKKELEKLTRILYVPPPKREPSKYVFQLQSNGRIGQDAYYFITLARRKQTQLYRNKLYSGKIVAVKYSDDELVRLSVNAHSIVLIHPAVSIDINAELRLKYIGPYPVPKETEPVFAEVVVEGNVIT